MTVDNLDAAQALVSQIDILTKTDRPAELVGSARGAMTVDVALECAKVRALIDIARSVRGIETFLNEWGGGTR